MSDFLFQVTGGGARLTLQAGFSGEVDTSNWWRITPLSPIGGTFFVVPSGPVLFQTAGLPPYVDETLTIAEDPDPIVIAAWAAGKAASPSLVRSFVLPAGVVFKQFIPVNGPYIAVQVVGLSSISVVPNGLVNRGPSTIRRTNAPIITIAL